MEILCHWHKVLNLISKEQMNVSKDILIEDLVNQFPNAIDFLSTRKIRCIRCGEPIWGTLAEAAKEKGYTDHEIDLLVNDLNQII